MLGVRLLFVGAALVFLVSSPTDALEASDQKRKRIWVDTDAACGVSGRVDPDDCFALIYLLSHQDIEIVGVSTVFGNAAIFETDRVARELIGMRVPVYRGAAGPGERAATPSAEGLALALESGPLTLLALGPLTNFHALFLKRPDLVHRVEEFVAVMGKREGHLFHPSEGSPTAAFFGHGPIFTDFNFVKDPDAARAVMALSLPKTLVPYEVARQVTLSGDDVRDLASKGGVVGRVAERSAEWLSFWREIVGRDGFYPFDLVAAAYVGTPGIFSCRRTSIRIGSDRRAYGPLPGPRALMVGGLAGASSGVLGEVGYCDQLRGDLERSLFDALAGGQVGGQGID